MSDEEPFAAAYRAHYWAVSRFVARRLGGQRADVEEIVADAFVVAWRRRHELPAEPLPWLYGVARYCLANAVRGAGRHRRLLQRIGHHTVAHRAHVVDSPAAGTPGDWVHEALAQLPEADQEVLRLTAWEGLEARDIAIVVGCSTHAATMRVHRARRRLRERIDALPVHRAVPAATTTVPDAAERQRP
ncbi:MULTISPECIES: RNA polymerase sigma factor [unclassified Streptomyces]|uniref:RNA polymerase sigma factor n=1 Tax=unclassified Streptomyces TaxID=2593676 RepID=UPI002E78B5E2|nr:RNA polymerase sigma factor [Streptomyces sp. JV176]MEE1799321.1 RNA polymerase sigma factor [Streptomyces sp. JV176]